MVCRLGGERFFRASASHGVQTQRQSSAQASASARTTTTGTSCATPIRTPSAPAGLVQATARALRLILLLPRIRPAHIHPQPASPARTVQEPRAVPSPIYPQAWCWLPSPISPPEAFLYPPASPPLLFR